jgi:hypothetical protein
MTTNQKLLWGGIGLLVLIFVCCFGLVLGSTLSNQNTTPPSQAAASNTPTSPPATVIVLEPTGTLLLEPSPTPTLVVPSPTPIVIVVTATPLPAEPPTTVPTLPPVTPIPPPQPTNPDADFQALLQYAEAIKPILDEGMAAAERDGDILKASEQNPEALCGGGLNPHPTLAADATAMDNLVNRLNRITPPAEAAEPVHKPLKESMRLWGDALNNINLSCQTDDPAAQGLLRLGAILQLGGSLINFHVANDNFWQLAIVNGLEAIVGPPPR